MTFSKYCCCCCCCWGCCWCCYYFDNQQKTVRASYFVISVNGHFKGEACWVGRTVWQFYKQTNSIYYCFAYFFDKCHKYWDKKKIQKKSFLFLLLNIISLLFNLYHIYVFYVFNEFYRPAIRFRNRYWFNGLCECVCLCCYLIVKFFRLDCINDYVEYF